MKIVKEHGFVGLKISFCYEKKKSQVKIMKEQRFVGVKDKFLLRKKRKKKKKKKEGNPL